MQHSVSVFPCTYECANCGGCNMTDMQFCVGKKQKNKQKSKLGNMPVAHVNKHSLHICDNLHFLYCFLYFFRPHRSYLLQT